MLSVASSSVDTKEEQGTGAHCLSEKLPASLGGENSQFTPGSCCWDDGRDGDAEEAGLQGARKSPPCLALLVSLLPKTGREGDGTLRGKLGQKKNLASGAVDASHRNRPKEGNWQIGQSGRVPGCN